MLHGRSFALAFLVVFLVVLPSFAVAAPPQDRGTVQTVGTSGVTDLAISPSGQFATAVLNYASTAGSPACGLLSTTCPTGTHQDLYYCDFSVSSGGCSPSAHAAAPSVTVNTAQAVDATSYTVTGGVDYDYAIAGPGEIVSMWSFGNSKANFEAKLGSGLLSGNSPSATTVAIAPDGQHALFGARQSGSSAGSLYYFTSTGTQVWTYPLVDAQQSATNATALAWARNGGRVAIGTPTGLQFLVPGDTVPASSASLHPFDTPAVTDVAISAAGDVVAAATNGHTFFVRIDLTTGEVLRPAFSRQADNAGNVQVVALSQDGERFASASGSKISFFHVLHNSAIAQFDGDNDTGAPVTDLSYDATGRLLVATSGSRVLGFGPTKTTPLWSFDATTRGLDAPLTKVRVADGWFDNTRHAALDSQRIVVAGKTKVMAFDTVTSALATLTSPNGPAITPGTAVPLTLQLTNTGSLADNYTFVVQPPASTVAAPWTATSAMAVPLDPDASATVSLSVTPPPGQAPGTYVATVEVHAKGYEGKAACGSSPDTIACPTFSMTLARAVALQLNGPTEKRLLKQGGEDTIPLTITNVGNADGIVNLTATQLLSRGSPWAAPRFTPGPRDVRVPAGGSVDVNMVVSAPNDAASGERNVINVTASEGTTVAVSKEFTVYVDAQFGSEMTSTNDSLALSPGEVKTLTVNVHNTGNTDDLYNITFALTPASATNDWRIFVAQPNITVPFGQVRPITVTIRPLVAEPREASLALTATSQGDPHGATSNYAVALVAKPAVTTPADNGGKIPGPEPILVVGLVGLAALARRLGARR